MARRRKSGRRRKPRELMTPEEIRRAKKKAIRRKREQAKRRFYTVLFLALAVFAIGFFVVMKKPAEETVSGNGLPTAGLASNDNTEGYSYNGASSESEKEEVYVPEDLSGVIDLSVPLDVTKGKAAFSMDTVSGDSVSELSQVKGAMAQAAYFAGSTTPLSNYLTAYGEGKWHAVRTNGNEIVAFYEGVHKKQDESEKTDESGKTDKSGKKDKPEKADESVKTIDVPFKVSFTVYEDGSFYVLSVEEDESVVEDYESWLMKLVKGEAAIQEPVDMASEIDGVAPEADVQTLQ